MVALLQTIEDTCRIRGLTVLGVVAEGEKRIALVGLRADGWEKFAASAEYRDGAANPLDRWSLRVLPEIATETGALDVRYPFGGPPYEPFIRWSFDSGETFSSPVGMLVHHRAGFWISFRGALVFDAEIDRKIASHPCVPCDRPCEIACPVGALAPEQDYDVPSCKSHLASPEGNECRDAGCLVRRACPVSQAFGRSAEQSAFHMRSFLGV